MSEQHNEKEEWIIQRCTQEWINNELQYQDWGPYGPAIMTPITKSEMLDAIEAFQQKWPAYEFRGHNVGNCKCAEHVALKARVTP